MQNSIHRCSEREKDRSSDKQESRFIEDKLKAANKCYQEKLILYDKYVTSQTYYLKSIYSPNPLV